MKLLTSNSKLLKGDSYGYINIGLSLAPHTMASKKSLCPNSTESCRETCLVFSGRNSFQKVIDSKIKKTEYYLNNKEEFLRQLDAELFYYKKYAAKRGKKLAIRLNVTSDIYWQRQKINGKTLFELHPDIQFYDYTKNYKEVSLFPNYHFTYSYELTHHQACMEVLNRGDNLAVVFQNTLPTTLFDREVIDGDLNDLRFLDSSNIIVGLKYKNVIKKNVNNNKLKQTSSLIWKQP